MGSAVGKWTALDARPPKALVVLLPREISLPNLELTLLSLEATPLKLDLTLFNLELTHNSLEVILIFLELTLLDLEAILHSLEAISHKVVAILLHQVAINLRLQVTLPSQGEGVILPNMVTILKWSHSREAIQYSQERIQGSLEDIHHLHLATLLRVKSQQQLEQQGLLAWPEEH